MSEATNKVGLLG